jgi:serine/threonine protein kinase
VSDIPARLAEALRDRYRFVRELGSGGMGSVYLAEDLKHHRKVAVKVLHPHLAASLGIGGPGHGGGPPKLKQFGATPNPPPWWMPDGAAQFFGYD